MEFTPAIDALIRQIDDGLPCLFDGLAAAPHTKALCETLCAASDAREALLNLYKIASAAGEALESLVATVAPTALVQLLRWGPELSRYLAWRPARMALLRSANLSQARSKDSLAQELAARLVALAPDDVDSLRDLVVGFRNEHYLRLAAREFAAAPLEEVCAELSDLADVCIEAALAGGLAVAEARYGPPLLETGGRCGIAVIAMGKYGARELNFCSDIDVVYIYESDEGAAGRVSLNEFFARACRETTKVLAEPASEGFAFRVDLRLRPEGARGPMCNSIAGAEHFYEAWGGPYDRLAWLKARTAAGTMSVGNELIGILTPFVYPRTVSYDVVEQIQGLTRRIRTELITRRGPPGFNVKLDPGGIRDVEFFTQVLQLLHGGKQPVLRDPATLRALDQLLFAGLISEEERAELAEAYELLRRIEHRVQLYEGHQTHLLAQDEAIRRRVAQHLGYTLDAFEAELAARREKIAHIYQTLAQPEDHPAWIVEVMQPEQEQERIEEIFAERGFASATEAATLLGRLKDKPWGPLGRVPSPAVRALAEPLLAGITSSPDPDAALLHFSNLSLRFGRYRGLWDVLASAPEILQLLCSVFGSSDLLAGLLLQQPALIDELSGAGTLVAIRDLGAQRALLERRLGDSLDTDPERALAEIERFHGEELLRIGLADVAGKVGDEQVWAQLTHLAEVVIEAVYQLQLRQTAARFGWPQAEDGRPATMCIIGLGKLGAEEMSYGSDLDILFVYSQAGKTASERRSIDNGEFFSKVAQGLIRSMASGSFRGRLYDIDTRLRPSGSQGTLVVSLAGFAAYHQGRAQPWEHQVLLRARAIAGDPELGAEAERWIEHFVGQKASAASHDELLHLRERIEGELAHEDRDHFNFKLGRGGLLDIEFIAQSLQLRHGATAAGLRVRPTRAVLAAARDAGLLGAEQATALLASHRFLRTLEGRLRIVRGSSAERLPRNAAALEVEARRMGYRRRGAQSAGEQLLTAYEAHTNAVREHFDAIMGQTIPSGDS